ncbi:hypothetical protein [Burkholderia pseudomallei]|uniref:hypothetical protein n=1 Tax=Burkholderia pseudomallei TaxID=28450 RepID=UPI0005E7B5DA|nr:hypothetical protein [Burkholderia pseudomallei]CAK0115264.1 Uncharacterised protein [Burkholderia pseudomallei]CFW00298.1 Uncharacterised protein [Burkholderia pseudomallei]
MTIKEMLGYLWALITTAIGLAMWQYQLIAKRRYDVAEHALTVAGKAAQALRHIRQAEASVEMAKRLNPQGPPLELWLARQTRIQESEEVFSELEAVSKLVAMHFGQAAATSFRDLAGVYAVICEAQTSLYYRGDAEKMYPSDEQTQRLAQTNAVLNAQERDDSIAQNIEETENRIDAQFSGYLRPNAWRLFLPFWSWKR